MNYLITKQPKSKGIAILLVILFGPLGMFYSTIAGGLTMTLAAPILVLSLFGKAWSSHDFAFNMLGVLWTFLSYILCFLWAVSAVKDYNSKILTEAYDNNYPSIPTETKEMIYQNLERIKKLHVDGILTDEMYEQQKNEYLHRLGLLDQSQTSLEYQVEFDKTFRRNRNAYKSWIIVLLVVGLIGTWLILWADNRNKKQESITQTKTIDYSSPEEKVTESIRQTTDFDASKKVLTEPLPDPILNTDAIRINIKEKGISGFKVNSASDGTNIESSSYFIFTDKNIYLIKNDVPIKYWRVIKTIVGPNGEGDEIITKEGDNFILFGSVRIVNKQNEEIGYDGDFCNIEEVELNSKYIKK
ncbi:hypothetical protein [Pinibacter aurantiacus]|uniref:SHOCT domain-containing protein n=1 Tax=Pinibacter aurantiacus TaxID=2851599 RepID=A0A9E2S630_9BACT|nr:hypothetical protein [Pinibacter aurantiacus]MBV4356307.1 hypothetical protein [Pinibacter aurantiacus]